MRDLSELLERPIAFHRCLVDITGSILGALMLSQGVYWSKRSETRDGWFYKTQEQWTLETAMTRCEQETARRALMKAGIWEEKHERLAHRKWYRVKMDVLSRMLSGDIGECAPDAFGEAAAPHSSNRAETTSETTNIDHNVDSLKNNPSIPPPKKKKESSEEKQQRILAGIERESNAKKIFAAYPKNPHTLGKPTLQLIQNKLRKFTFEQMMAGTLAYARTRSGEDERFTKNAYSWFRADEFLREHGTPKIPDVGNNGPRSTGMSSAEMRASEEAADRREREARNAK